MHNTGPKMQQDFFFPVERWGENPDSDNQGKSDDIDYYQIIGDGKGLKSTNVAGPKQKSSEAKEETSEAKQESSKPNEKTTEKPAKRLKTAVRRQKRTTVRRRNQRRKRRK